MYARRTLVVAWIPAIFLIAELPGECLADKVVLKSGKTYHGRIVEETDTSVTIETDDGKTTKQPKSIVKQILKSEINEQELEALRPDSPERYFEVGLRLADDADDPRIRGCAQHLLQVAIERDDNKFGIPGNMMLARLTDGEERIRYLLEVFRRDSSQDLIKEQLLAAKNQAFQEHQVFPKLRRDSQKTSMAIAIREESDFLAAQLAPVWPRLPQDIAKLSTVKEAKPCNICKGMGVRPCGTRGCVKGVVSCGVCKGEGTLTRTRYAVTTSGGGFNVDKVTCDRCDGRPKWQCRECGGAGKKPCLACSGERAKGEKTKSIPLPPDLEQKLDMVSSLVSRQPDTSWARELLVDDRTPFRGLATKGPIPDTVIKGRYYRRGGDWKDRPN